MAQVLDNSNRVDSAYSHSCDVCENEYCLEDLFQCQHPDCIADKKIYCKECGLFWHKKRKKDHPFVFKQQIKSKQNEGIGQQVMNISTVYHMKINQ